MKRMYVFFIILSLIGLSTPEIRAEDAATQMGAEIKTIKSGAKVKFDYSLTVDGKEVENSQESGPMAYTQGDGNLIPGLTKQMEGMKIGEEKTIVVSPAEGYGQVDPKAVQEVPKSAMPADIKLEPGLFLQMNDPQGNAYPAVVKEVKEDKVVMDFNHPLAGKELTFNVKIVDIQ